MSEIIRSKLEIRFHGRGGQGAVTAAHILVEAVLEEGKWGQAIPLFGAERRGAPVVAYARVAERKLSYHSSVREPDVIVVLDPYVILVVDIFKGLSPGGTVVMNYPREPVEYFEKTRGKVLRMCYVNATQIALKYGLIVAGWPVVNTAMLGALAKATGVVSLESLERVIRRRWHGKLGEANALAARTAFSETSCMKGLES